jgi:hypothetical protein
MIAVIRAAEAINPLPFTRNGHPNMCRRHSFVIAVIFTIVKMAKNRPRKQTYRHTAQYRMSKMLLIGHCARQSKTKQQKHEREKLRQKHDIGTWWNTKTKVQKATHKNTADVSS